ncbi:hypothetical protein X777_11192 [Ooceraea biroi]|uniref:Uncharacterized protein n=1 Tax=Ooceraea biroi TaxID=2015173 RepID=A0A026W450_OOCBI|nr:hypothetical protein X777_11192 [Ooceraea biroi]
MTCDARQRLVDGSERSQYYYDQTHYARDVTERYRTECERLLGQRSVDSGGPSRVKDRAQRMAENGEALKYIELVLRQLRQASRDHRELMRQRHANFQHEMSKRMNERVWDHHHHRDGRVDDSTYASRTCSRSSSSPWESDVTLRKSRPDVTTRLLTKRRDYGGTAQSTVDILRPVHVQERVQDGVAAAAYQEMRYIPENIGWKDARKMFGAWSLPEASSSNDRRTSSTVV